MSQVERMFNGRSVFITGATGFIGRVLVEKILNSYPNFKNMYLLVRSKKNCSPKDRLFKNILNAPIFDHIKKRENSESLFEKIIVISGDISEQNLGISDNDMQILLSDQQLSLVYHCAATIKFDEPLQVSIKLNLKATQTLLNICKQLNNLLCFCHVSTAYVNSDIKNNSNIEEILYPVNQKPDDIIKLAEILDEQTLQILKPALVNQRPNTYTYTKALAEHLVCSNVNAGMPICIIRPSIVTASWRKPIKGWIDNLNGPTGLILAIGKGLLRSLYVDRKVVADMIPVDVVVNTMIATSLYTAKVFKKLDEPANEVDYTQLNKTENNSNNNQDNSCQEAKQVNPLIVHCTSGDSNPLTWGDAEDAFFPSIRAYPSCTVYRYPFGTFKGNKYHDLITKFFVHIIPALLIDLLCFIMGRKRQLMFIYKRLHTALNALEHFCTQNYNFKSRNINLVRNSLNDYDKDDLYTSIKDMSWVDYWYDYVLGARQFILKESNDTLPKAKESFNRAYYVEIAMRTILLSLIFYFTKPFIFCLVQNMKNLVKI